MDNSLKTKEKTAKAEGLTPPAKSKTKTFLIGKVLKTKDLLRISGCWRGVCSSGKRIGNKAQGENPRIAYAERRVKPLRGSYAALRPRE